MIVESRDQHIIALYRRMPGAPPPPQSGWNVDWDAVAGNAHWEFCAAIVDRMIAVAQAYSR